GAVMSNGRVGGLGELAGRYAADLSLTDADAERLSALEAAAYAADAQYREAAAALSNRRRQAAADLDSSVNRELKPLKLGRARFMTEIMTEPESAGPHGIDRIEFWVQTNPGTRPAPLMRGASGGGLAPC